MKEEHYCNVCTSCGEEDCCSPLNCTQQQGMYCQDYLKDLKFGYKMYLDLEKLLKENNILLEEVETIFNNNYNLIYENRLI